MPQNSKDPKKAAQKAGLKYAHDNASGIIRKKAGKKFKYFLPNGKIVNQKTMARINSIRIPPAWTDVWICTEENGHLQVTGRDSRGRKQYLYHPKWRKIRDENKYDRMLTFAEVLPKLRRKVSQDFEKTGISRARVLAAVIKIMEKTLIRVGNEEYAKDNHSYGLTTLKRKHVDVHGSTLHFHFKGKSGVLHDIQFDSPKLAKLVRKCEEIPGQELFCYKDEDGKIHDINSTDVNEYLKEISGQDITAKDFRTWFGSLGAMKAFSQLPPPKTKIEGKKNLIKVVGIVAEHLGNTKAVCRKCYIYPGLMDCYLKGENFQFYYHSKKIEQGLHSEEHALMYFIKKN